ncbi:hypothetical protein CR513_27335, partial [Mucuna pruriens]
MLLKKVCNLFVEIDATFDERKIANFEDELKRLKLNQKSQHKIAFGLQGERRNDNNEPSQERNIPIRSKFISSHPPNLIIGETSSNGFSTKNKVLNLIPPPRHQSIIGTRWIFTNKVKLLETRQDWLHKDTTNKKKSTMKKP